MSEINATLAQRGTRYGEFHQQAEYATSLKDVFRSSPNWLTMTPDMKEGLDMIANKIARILNGDPTYTDSWHDLAGYATLVEKRLEELQAKPVTMLTATEIMAEFSHYLKPTRRDFKVGDRVLVVGDGPDPNYSPTPRIGATGRVASVESDRPWPVSVRFGDGEAYGAFRPSELKLIDG